MTTEEAKEILSTVLEYTHIDCDYGYYKIDGSVKLVPGKDIAEALEMAIAALRAQQERENPKPLTLEELREMDGEPVYLDLDTWAIVKYDVGDPLLVFNEGSPCDAKLWYEKIEPAYRNKPKEG